MILSNGSLEEVQNKLNVSSLENESLRDFYEREWQINQRSFIQQKEEDMRSTYVAV